MFFAKFRFQYFLLAIVMSLPLFLVSCADQTNASSAEIPIAMAMDENYLYPTIVSITSVMENKNSDTSYDFYIMHPDSLDSENQKKVLSLQNKYRQCHIHLINMNDKYSDAHIDPWISAPTYYRLSLPDILPYSDKIIWMDGDTLTFHDLKELFDIDMNGYYFKGFLDNLPFSAANEGFDTSNDHYICAGVMLVNLKELRENNMSEKFSEFIRKNNNKLKQHDQTVINTMCYEKIGILPARYGIFNIINEQNAADYLNILSTPQKYTINEIVSATNDPTILHCISKPWISNANINNKNLWLKYAQKTDFSKEIKNKYSL